MLEKIKVDFSSEYKSNSDIKSILEKVSKGTANLIDVEKYSRTLGNILSQSLKKFVTPDSLPDERLYYNIAQTVLEPMLKDNYEFVNDLASQVQKSIDSKAKIQLTPQKAIYPIERINQVINAVSDVKAEWETIQRRLDSPVCTVTESFYDDYVKENAKFKNDSGLNCYITRTASANCCKWCSSLAGRYAYSDAPPDIYRRHDNCTCTVTFENGKTRQDVWSKKTWQVKETSKENYKPVKLSRKQAKALEQKNLQYKGIDIAGRSGIIESGGKITDSNFTQIEKFEQKTKDFYNARILNNDDVKAIVQNTDFDYDDILAIKNHIMIQEHLFSDGSIRKFDPDIDPRLLLGKD